MIINVLAISSLTLGLLSFGYTEYFDRLFLIYLISLSAVYIKNINVVSLLAILLIERVIEEVVYFSNTLIMAKIGIYILTLLLIKLLWYDKIVKMVVLPIIVLVLLAECYWALIEYNSPRIHFYIGMIWLNVITRHLIFMRAPLIKQYLSAVVNQTSIDWQLYSIAKWNVVVIVALICEYLLRHLTPASPMFVYEHYRYAMQILSVATVYFLTKYILSIKFKIKA
ncbi:MAG: hypothetical protein ACI9LM_001371 [Alteromonadaceae bacterium]|jgi:hypothetical protein